MKLIPLTQGKFAKVDDYNFDLISNFVKNNVSSSWYFNDGYARCKIKTESGWKVVSMHHLVCPPVDGLEIDHVDGDGVNNQHSNLRYVSESQQCQNRRIASNNISGVKGVHKRYNGRWQAEITFEGKKVYLGTFTSFDDAVEARRAAEKEYFGDYACSNIERPITRVKPKNQNGIHRLSEFF